jgi:hypothetical protein
MKATQVFYLTDLDFMPKKAWRFKSQTFPCYNCPMWIDFMLDGKLMQGNTLTGSIRPYKVSIFIRIENFLFVHVIREKHHA